MARKKQCAVCGNRNQEEVVNSWKILKPNQPVYHICNGCGSERLMSEETVTLFQDEEYSTTYEEVGVVERTKDQLR